MMNEYEIDDHAAIIARGAPQFSKYATFLQDWRDVVNHNSDGWHSWTAARRSADALVGLIERVVGNLRGSTPRLPGGAKAPMPTEAEFRKALTPIRSFATKHGRTAPTLQETAPQAKAAAQAPATGHGRPGAATDPGLDVQVFLDAARQHGEDSEPDHEVGDLQTYFRAAYDMLTPEQRRAMLADADVRSCIETGMGIEELPEDPAAAEDWLRSAAGASGPKP